MHTKIVAVLLVAAALSACETPTTQRYAISADNNQAIKSLGASNIGVATFRAPADFSANCRALGPMQVADGLTHTQYIQKAFEDELKIAGAYASSGAQVVISGRVHRLEFSSTRALTGGSWTIDLALESSNGKSVAVNEYYEFSSGFGANDACRNTAEAFSRAVQDLIGKVVRNPGFAALLSVPGVPTPLATTPRSLQVAPVAIAPQTSAAPRPAIKSVSQGSHEAERLAKEQNCSAHPVASLFERGDGFETYSVGCSGGEAMAIRCELGSCKVIR